MGSVWEATQEYPVRRRVAIKLIKAGFGSRETLVRFEAERQALAMMDHPNIARILDAGTTGEGQPWFAMELVQGIPLTKFCDANQLSIDSRLTLFIDICAGVQHAHQKGVIHRDLKPGNIVVALIDGQPVPKVIDFGLAKALESVDRLTDQTMQTGVGQVLGTLKYMSPEQASLDAIDIDTRTDVFALGTILYELLTGSTPLDDVSLRSQPVLKILELIREREPSKPSQRLATVEPEELLKITTRRQTESARLMRLLVGDLDWIVLKAIEKERERRYESAAGLADDIRRFLDNEPVEARPPSRAYRLRKFVRKNRISVAATGIVFGTLIAGIIGTGWGLMAANRAWTAEAKRAVESAKRLTQVEKGNTILTGVFRDLDIRDVRDGDEPLEAILARRLINAGDQLDVDAIGVPDTVAMMKDQLGNSLVTLGFAKEAIPLFQEAVAVREKLLGTNNPDYLTSRHGLAEALFQSGAAEEALPIFEQTLAMRSSSLGDQHADTLASKNNLAECYRSLGRLDKAEPLIREAFDGRKELLGPAHRDTLSSMNNLALTYLDEGKLDLAVPLLEDDLKLSRENLGPDHHYTLAAINNLATAYRDSNRIPEAVQLLEQVFATVKEKRGETHPATMKCMGNLADAYRATGDLDRALPLFQKSHDLLLAKLGPSHTATLTSSLNLAETYLAAGPVEKAINLYKESLDVMRANHEADHPLLLSSLEGLATALWTNGQAKDAIPVFEELLRIQEQKLGRKDFDTLSTMANLGLVYRDTNHLDQAISMMEEVAGMVDQFPPLGRVRRELRIAYLQAGRNSDFERMFQVDIVTVREANAPGSLPLAGELAAMANDLLTIGDFVQAESLLRESYEIRKTQLIGDWRTFNTQSMLGQAMVSRAIAASVSETKAEPEELANSLSVAGVMLIEAYEGLRAVKDSIPPNARALRLTQAVNRLIDWAKASRLTEELKKWEDELELLKSN